MPDIPRARLPHPVAGTGQANMTAVAARIAPLIMALLSGSPCE
jgi:hypothetical protein